MSNAIRNYAFMVGEFDDWTRGIDDNIRLEMKERLRHVIHETFHYVSEWTMEDSAQIEAFQPIANVNDDEDHDAAIIKWLEQVNQGRPGDRFFIDPDTGRKVRCCKYYNGEWRSCRREPLLIGPSLEEARQWTVLSEVGNIRRNIPVYIEASWTCEAEVGDDIIPTVTHSVKRTNVSRTRKRATKASGPKKVARRKSSRKKKKAR